MSARLRSAASRLSRISLHAVLALLLLGAACAGPGRAGSGGNRNLISSTELDEMRQAGVRDLHEVVTRLRPRWLDIRSERSLQLETVVLVYFNDNRLGGVDALRGYPLDGIASLRYLDAAQAMLLPGAGSAHVEGAIVISTTRTR